MPEKMRALWKGTKGEDGLPVEYLEGVPARSLTQDEYDALTDEQREAMRSSPLYDVRTEREMTPTTKKDGE